MKYETPFVNCDCSKYSLQEAASYLPPAYVFDLYVNPQSLINFRGLLREIAADVKANPLAPYINLHAEPSFGRDEWCLAVGGKAIGSKGA
jgi:hypothetical protein